MRRVPYPLPLRAQMGPRSLQEGQLRFSVHPSSCCGTLTSVLSTVMGQDVYDVGQSIADLGESDKSQE